MSVPGQADTEQRANPADPPQIFAERQGCKPAWARRWQMILCRSCKQGDHLDHAAGRSLQNKLLGLACAAGNSEALDIALLQSENLNMSLSMGGLQALNHIQHEHRGTALARFYRRWHEQALVMEKWLMLSATSASHGTIENVRALMQDPVFDASNPNKLRSVLGHLQPLTLPFSIKRMAQAIALLPKSWLHWINVTRKSPHGWALP